MWIGLSQKLQKISLFFYDHDDNPNRQSIVKIFFLWEMMKNILISFFVSQLPLTNYSNLNFFPLN